jgi:hypothetical protein
MLLPMLPWIYYFRVCDYETLLFLLASVIVPRYYSICPTSEPSSKHALLICQQLANVWIDPLHSFLTYFYESNRGSIVVDWNSKKINRKT